MCSQVRIDMAVTTLATLKFRVSGSWAVGFPLPTVQLLKPSWRSGRPWPRLTRVCEGATLNPTRRIRPIDAACCSVCFRTAQTYGGGGTSGVGVVVLCFTTSSESGGVLETGRIHRPISAPLVRARALHRCTHRFFLTATVLQFLPTFTSPPDAHDLPWARF